MEVKIDDFAEYDQERLYVCQLITNTELLREVYPSFDPDLLSNQYSQIVGKWIKHHFKETQCAPGKDIATIFSRRSREIHDKNVVRNISILLQSLSSDWEKYRIVNVKINSKAILEYLDEQNAKRLQSDVNDAISTQDFERIPSLTSNYKKIQRVSVEGESIFKNPHKFFEAFQEESQRLFKLQGDFGEVMGWFRRGEFSAVVAPTKGGKSFLKWYCARMALRAGCKVVRFNCEINEHMDHRRIFQDLSGMPRNSGKVKLGFFDEEGNIDYKYIYKDGVAEQGSAFFQKKMEQYNNLYRLGDVVNITVPRGTATLSDLRDHTKRLWEYHGFQADFAVIDYMDVLKSDRMFKDKHDAENHKWESTGAWAEDDNIGILSSTQGNLDSFEGKSFGAKGVGGVYLKLSHLDKLIALYSGEVDQEQKLIRAKRLFGRDESPRSDECVILTGLDIGRFYLDSRMSSEVLNLERESEKKGRGR